MKVSVVVPTFKRPALLVRCLKALVEQRFPADEYEIIVVSDGPDESTGKAILSLGRNDAPRIRFLSLAEKKGPAAARNLGWRSASAKLIAFTDDDCIPDSKWLLELWHAYLWTPGSKAAFTGRTIVPIPSVPTDYEQNIAQLAKAEFITANCACTRSALEKAGGFDEQFTMAWREDSDLQFRFLLLRIPIVGAPRAVVTHPVRKAPWGISIRDEKKNVFNALLYKKFPDLYKQKIQPAPPWNYYAIAFSLLLCVGGAFSGIGPIAVGGIGVWTLLTSAFIMKRLRNTSRSPEHVMEMIITSAVIPGLSLFWRLYGSWKFKTLLLP